MNNHFNLYNKYRPTSFDEVVGQTVICRILINSLKQKQTAQSYIFSGPRGTGKTSLARILAKAINCLNFNNDVCNKCDNCLVINQKQTTDIIELDAASNNGVENIRDLIANAQYLPTNCLYKVYIIDEAHMLSNSAWNALLKIVEEPPTHVIFIFSTTEFNKIIPTIQSRCQKYHFFLLNPELITDQIINIAKKEDYEISLEAANKIAQLAQGSLRDALSLLSQVIIYTNGPIKLIDVEKLLFLADQGLLMSFLKSLFDGDLITCLTVIQNVYFQGLKLENFFSDLINIIIDLVVYQKSQKDKLLQTINLQDVKTFSKLPINLENYLFLLETIIEELKKSQNTLIVAKLGLIKLVNIAAEPKTSTTKSSLKTPTLINQDSSHQIITEKKLEPAKEIVNYQPSKPFLENNDKFVHDKNLFKTKTIDINQAQLAAKLNFITKQNPTTPSNPTASTSALDSFNKSLQKPPWPTDVLIANAILKAKKHVTNKISQSFIEKLDLIDQNSIDPKNLIQNKLFNFLKKLKKANYLILCSEQVTLISFEAKIFVLEFNNRFLNFDSLHELNQLLGTSCYWVGIDFKKFKSLVAKKNQLKLEPMDDYFYQPPENGAKYHEIVKMFNESFNNKE